MISYIQLGLSFLWSHKLKYAIALASFVIFAIFLFPFQDVGDFAGAQVATATNNQVFLQFDRLRLGIFPAAHVGVENVTLETPSLPAITAQDFEIRPSISSLIFQKPEGQVLAKGLFRGDVSFELKPGRRTEAGNTTQILALHAEKLSLAEIHKVAELPVLLKGKINLNTTGTADLSFQEQPDFDVDLVVDHFELPSSTVNTMMGPLNLPELKLTSLELKGRLSAGKFNIEKSLIGKDGDEVTGSVKGNISIVLQNQGQVQPVIGAYQFDVDLNIKKSFQDKATLFLSFLDAYKTPTTEGAKFQFKLNATSLQMPPSISALR